LPWKGSRRSPLLPLETRLRLASPARGGAPKGRRGGAHGRESQRAEAPFSRRAAAAPRRGEPEVASVAAPNEGTVGLPRKGRCPGGAEGWGAQTKTQFVIMRHKSTISIKRRWNALDIRYLKGVGEKRAAQLAKLELFTAEDLLQYYPRDYVDYSQ